MNFRASGKTDRGTVRPVNEDTFLVDEKNGLFIVADGMGGHDAGDVASKMLVENVQEFLNGKFHEDAAPDYISSILKEAVQKANQDIYYYSQENGRDNVMGATTVVMVLVDERYFLCWAGDSRAYLFRDGSLVRLTRDHSYVQKLVDAGEISEDEARVHPRRNVVTRAVGVDADIEAACAWGQSIRGDVFLLCSDGLTGPLDDSAIGNVLAKRSAKGSELPVLNNHLLDSAIHAGGDDNITVLVIELF